MTAVEKNLNRLKKMCGNKFRYNNEEFKILTFKKTGDDIEIVTDADWIKTNIFDLGVELDRMTEVIVPSIKKDAIVFNEPKFLNVKNALLDKSNKMLSSLLDDLEKADSKEITKKIDNVVKISDAIIKNELTKVKIIQTVNSL